ncbi:hypothetical protein ACWD0J_40500 [Streptomyces sp. NPDC003011]
MGDTGRSARRRATWLVCGLIPLLAVVGCSAADADTEASAGPPPIEVTPIKNPGNIEQPLNSYIMTQHQSQLMFAAEQRLRIQCAQRFGLQWEPPPVDLDVPDTFHYGADAYIRYDEDAARRHGYHAALAGDAQADARDTPESEGSGEGADAGAGAGQEFASRLSPQLRSVLTGQGSRSLGGKKVPDGGCVAEARRTLRQGSDPEWNENYPNALAINLQGKITEDPRVVGVLAKWSACMKRAGFDYEKPKDAWADPRWEATDSASTLEKAVAVAEVRCGRTARVAETMAAVERAYQERVVDEQSQQLAEYARGKEAVMARVARLLGR